MSASMGKTILSRVDVHGLQRDEKGLADNNLFTLQKIQKPDSLSF
jgi:hypothetical protein